SEPAHQGRLDRREAHSRLPAARRGKCRLGGGHPVGEPRLPPASGIRAAESSAAIGASISPPGRDLALLSGRSFEDDPDPHDLVSWVSETRQLDASVGYFFSDPHGLVPWVNQIPRSVHCTALAAETPTLRAAPLSSFSGTTRGSCGIRR